MKPNQNINECNKPESSNSVESEHNNGKPNTPNTELEVLSVLKVLSLSKPAMDALIMNATAQGGHTDAELSSICEWAHNIALGYFLLQSVLKGHAGIRAGTDGNPEFDFRSPNNYWYARIRALYPGYPAFHESDRIYLDPTLILDWPEEMDEAQAHAVPLGSQ